MFGGQQATPNHFCRTGLTCSFEVRGRHFHLPVGRKNDMWLEIDEHLQGGKKVLIIDEAKNYKSNKMKVALVFYKNGFCLR